jgi:hypothetical protein
VADAAGADCGALVGETEEEIMAALNPPEEPIEDVVDANVVAWELPAVELITNNELDA